jgi:alkaline phosphatase
MPCSSNNNQDEPQDCMNNISGNTKNNFINQPYITMSDPSNNGGNTPSTTEAGVHTADDAVLNAMGPGSDVFKGFIDNTEVFKGMVQALGLGRKK